MVLALQFLPNEGEGEQGVLLHPAQIGIIEESLLRNLRTVVDSTGAELVRLELSFHQHAS